MPVGQDFRVDDRIKIGRTTDLNLDGQYGTILGKAAMGFYIVGLDRQHPVSGYRAIMLIESCIDKLTNNL